MKKFILTPIRKKILVFWYQYHRKTNLWPTYREASLDIDLHYTQIGWQVRKLIDNGWMVKEGRQIGLTPDGEKALIDAELIALGVKQKDITISIVQNKIRKRNG